MREEFRMQPIPLFDRVWADSGGVSRIGSGDIGGKAKGLLELRELLAGVQVTDFEPIEIVVPTFTVIGTDVFDAFLERNDLSGLATSGESDERIAHAFQAATLPSEVLGDLRALTERVTWPLAVRSSSRLEDALRRPFAGVYETKMIPNNQPDANSRFKKLVEAIKFVYASTFFLGAREYLETIPDRTDDEKMAVIVQDVVGARHQQRFYPNLSGVVRSFNFYPLGDIPRENGIVDLALGLGKTIVDDGVAYSYVPSHPRRPPPFSSARDFLQNSQTKFWETARLRPYPRGRIPGAGRALGCRVRWYADASGLDLRSRVRTALARRRTTRSAGRDFRSASHARHHAVQRGRSGRDGRGTS